MGIEAALVVKDIRQVVLQTQFYFYFSEKNVLTELIGYNA